MPALPALLALPQAESTAAVAEGAREANGRPAEDGRRRAGCAQEVRGKHAGTRGRLTADAREARGKPCKARGFLCIRPSLSHCRP